MTSDPNLLFRQAAEASARGAFVDAVVLYRQVLELVPGHPQVWTALGNAEIALGRIDDGVASLQRSLALFDRQPDAWCNLARGLRFAGRHGEALTAADRALALAPNLFEAWTCRGNILWELQRLEEALAAYERAVGLRPSEPRAHFNHGNALHALQRTEEAVEAYRRALARAPDYVEALKNLAIALSDLRRAAEALPLIGRAHALRPDDADICSVYGMTLHAVGRFDEAAEPLQRAVALSSSAAVAVNNCGVNEHARGRLDVALADFDRAIALDPRNADAMVNRGTLLKDLGRNAEAAAAYDAALAISPQHSEAAWNKALLALLQGDFAAGWSGYEGRWRSKARPGPYLETSRPQWCGEDVAGKTVFLWQEQGFGDFIQFCRYVPLLVRRGARVLLQVPQRLKPLIATLGGPFDMVEPDVVPAAFDFHCPLMSLPLAFGTTIANVPAEIPYLAADSAKAKTVANALGAGPHIGLQWSANLAYIHGHTRHMPAEFIVPLLGLPATFHVLHKDFRPEDRPFLAAHPELRTHADEQADFSDAAALIAAMDLVITVDTVVPHLAGALGKPVWLMLPSAADWRWMLDRSDTPWYPTMRLFRQPAPGDWASVVGAVKSALGEFLHR